MAGMTTGCKEDLEMPPVSYPDGGTAETIGTGAWNDPYSVWQVLAGVDNGDKMVWVTGYIVGYINTFDGDYAKLREKSAVFSASGAPNSNLMLAMTPDETNWERCIPVQLAYGTSGRDLSLANHPEYLGRQVTLQGTSGTKYLSVYGLRNCDNYNWGDEGKFVPTEAEGYTTYLSNGLGEFYVDNITIPSSITNIWTWDSYNYAKASGYASNTNQNTDSYLVSPAITFDADEPVAFFSQAINYLRGANRADYLNVCIREVGSEEWTVADVSQWPAGDSWTFEENCKIDVSAYAGKTVQIAFHYVSNSACATTWEVKNLVVK